MSDIIGVLIRAAQVNWNVMEEDDEDSEVGKIYYAIQANDSVQLSYYLKSGADANLTFCGRDPTLRLRYSILHMCCQKGHVDCAKCLLDHGWEIEQFDHPRADVNARDVWSQTPLFFCVSSEWLPLVELLLARGADMEARDKDSRTPLHRAVRCSNTDVMQKLVEAGCDVNAVDIQSRSALWLAASEPGKVTFIQALLAAGADINDADAREKLSPLQVAVMRNHADVDVYVELLMSHGASVQAAGPVAPSPLHTVLLRGWGRGVSATQHDMKLIKLFLSAGCDVNHIRVGNVRPYLRGTALKLAAHRGCLDVVKVLLDAGADPNLTENLAVSPLLIATSEGHVEVTCQLAMYNASLDLAGYLKLMGGVQRISPFHVALQHGHLDGARMLILAGYHVSQEPWFRTKEGMPEVLQQNPDFWEWIQEFVATPPPLRQLVRRRVRRILGCPLNKKLERLTMLPQFLRNYILMLELESDL